MSTIHPRTARQIEAWRKMRGIRYANCTLDTFDTGDDPKKQAAVHRIGELLDRDRMQALLDAGTNVIFYGPTGAGKDHLLNSMILRLIQGGARVGGDGSPAPPIRPFVRRNQDTEPEIRPAPPKPPIAIEWVTGSDLLVAFRDFENARNLTKFRTVKLLAISDPVVGDSLTAFQAQQYFALLDFRYSHLLPTWITANIANSSELGQRTTPAIADRLKHDAIVIPCNWESYRQHQDHQLKNPTFETSRTAGY